MVSASGPENLPRPVFGSYRLTDCDGILNKLVVDSFCNYLDIVKIIVIIELRRVAVRKMRNCELGSRKIGTLKSLRIYSTYLDRLSWIAVLYDPPDLAQPFNLFFTRQP